ncbi:unnamed protein product [Peniophora sp. CBMAI 1063]|nr:unnamed protein product [Peniophora sp. CBMAI 1063]
MTPAAATAHEPTMYMFECTPTAALKLALDDDAAAADCDALEAPDDAAELAADTMFEERLLTALDALEAALVAADEPADSPLRNGRVGSTMTTEHGRKTYGAVLLPEAAELTALLEVLEADELTGCVTPKAPLVPKTLLMLLSWPHEQCCLLVIGQNRNTCLMSTAIIV